MNPVLLLALCIPGENVELFVRRAKAGSSGQDVPRGENGADARAGLAGILRADQDLHHPRLTAFTILKCLVTRSKQKLPGLNLRRSQSSLIACSGFRKRLGRGDRRSHGGPLSDLWFLVACL